MTVTAFASEEIAGWFRSFFSGRSSEGLSDRQLAYLAENEAPLSHGITHDGWTIELLSAIEDEVSGYMLFRVTAPEDYPLEPEKDDRDGNVIFGNFSRMHFQTARPDLLKASDGVFLGSWGFQWAEDGDGKANTRNFVLHLAPSKAASSVDPFGPEAKYSIYISDIVRETMDEKYYKQLMLTKDSGQDGVRFTEEELNRIYSQELLAEGTWEFTVTFQNSGNGLHVYGFSLRRAGGTHRQGADLLHRDAAFVRYLPVWCLYRVSGTYYRSKNNKQRRFRICAGGRGADIPLCGAEGWKRDPFAVLRLRFLGICDSGSGSAYYL